MKNNLPNKLLFSHILQNKIKDNLDLFILWLSHD